MLNNFTFPSPAVFLLRIFCFSSFVLLSPRCGLSPRAPHSQDSSLPLCLHTLMPAVAAEPPLPCFPRLNTLPIFTATLSAPVLTHPPGAGRGDRKRPSALLLFLLLPCSSLSFFSYTSLVLTCTWVWQYTQCRFQKNCNTSLPYFIYATMSSFKLQTATSTLFSSSKPAKTLLRHSKMSVKLINCDDEHEQDHTFFTSKHFSHNRWRDGGRPPHVSPVLTFMPAAAAGPPGSTAWMWQGLLPRTTKPQPTASPTIWGTKETHVETIWHLSDCADIHSTILTFRVRQILKLFRF